MRNTTVGYLSLVLLLTACTSASFAQNKRFSNYPTTLTVSLDSTGDYSSINEAINKFRAYSPQPITLYIKGGTYHEKVVVPSWISNLNIIGDSTKTTIIENADYAGKLLPERYIQVPGVTKFTTFDSYSLLISGNNISVQNLTMKNSSGPVGQAVTLHIEGDKVAIFNCSIAGHQDALFTGNSSSRLYFKDCHIEGTTDFIFGAATAIFQDCTIKSLSNSAITAASTQQDSKFGYVFFNCAFIADEKVNKAYIGRPWRAHAHTVLINCNLGSHIAPTGWDNWRDSENEKTVFYAEYNNTGAGADTRDRVRWSKQLTTAEAATYSQQAILRNWIPKPLNQ